MEDGFVENIIGVFLVEYLAIVLKENIKQWFYFGLKMHRKKNTDIYRHYSYDVYF